MEHNLPLQELAGRFNATPDRKSCCIKHYSLTAALKQIPCSDANVVDFYHPFCLLFMRVARISGKWVVSISEVKYWYFYMLQCKDGSIYSGITVDLDKRMQTHRVGKGSKYIRSRLPVSLAAWWKFSAARSDMVKLEQCIKSLPSGRKREIISNPALLSGYYGANTILLLSSRE
jgi:putative endonuclease